MKLATIPTKQYIEQREEEYWIEGTRISLDSVVYSFLNGESPESIAQNWLFSTLCDNFCLWNVKCLLSKTFRTILRIFYQYRPRFHTETRRAQNFPLLSLEQVYGAIAFYLANRELVDAYLKKGEAEFQQLQQSCREKSPLLYQKLKADQAYNMCLKNSNFLEEGYNYHNILPRLNSSP